VPDRNSPDNDLSGYTPRTPPTGPNLVGGEEWDRICQRLTLGYFNTEGVWVPGSQENIRDLRADMNKMLEAATKRDNVDRWVVRVVFVLVAARFLGIENLESFVKLFSPIH